MSCFYSNENFFLFEKSKLIDYKSSTRKAINFKKKKLKKKFSKTNNLINPFFIVLLLMDKKPNVV